MTNKEFCEALRAFGIHNSHNLLTAFGLNNEVAIRFQSSVSRSVIPSRSQVFSPHFPTNPGGPWYDYGCKTFYGKRSESLPKAVAWAQETYGLGEFVMNPLDRSYVPRALIERVKKELKNA